MPSFILIQSSYYDIGVDNHNISIAVESLDDPVIKPVHLAASAPLKSVYIEKFLISKILVSRREFGDFINETQYVTESEKEGWGWIWENGWIKKNGVSWNRPFGNKFDEIYREGEFPVIQVSWNDAVKFTEWKSQKDNIIYRLPYESEWEVFARTIGIKSFTTVQSHRASQTGDVGLFLDRLSHGGGYQTGLVWEWTLDWYAGYSPEQKNRDFGSIYKVLRGGSLLSNDLQRTSDFRFRRCPTARSPYYGFRIVKTEL
ncbi:MAG TPA: SUMF1/EgtB/PvdO family nonheme iron enzyme [Spirochaetota bacterium]|nr:SUMF1/EgtB/PvdO family nonheme iron enzyme [Spirochaetota bacterium]